jgi:beta-galactosidase
MFATRVKADTISDPYESEVTSARHKKYRTIKATLQAQYMNPILWNAEKPFLYTFVLTLQRDNTTTDCDVESCQLGFREIRIGGEHNTLQVNRKTITIAGVNRQEFNCRQGRAVSTADMIDEIRMMKKLNFNAVRLSHHCPHHQWLELCDAAGLYVICEANIETHGFQCLGQPVGYLSHLREWRGAMLCRTVRMFEHHKNFSSIIGWSLGNESGVGPNHEVMYSWLHERDHSGRFVQYESGGSRSKVTDIICPMYRRPDWCKLQALNDKLQRPVILCEYSHAMGNSAGGLHDYWTWFRDNAFPRFQGGFIWDFIDQGLLIENSPDLLEQVIAKSRRFKYGGDFGDIPNSKQFCINGILGPDRQPHPIAFEAAALQSPITFRLIEDGSNLFLAVKNWRSHENLSDLTLCIALGCELYPTEDASSTVNIPLSVDKTVEPGEEMFVPLSDVWSMLIESMFSRPQCLALGKSSISSIKEAWLNVSAVSSFDSFWIPVGHNVTKVSLRHISLLPRILQSFDKQVLDVPRVKYNLKVEGGAALGSNIEVVWENGGRAVIGAYCGRLISWTPSTNAALGKELLTSPLDICLWRAMTDNDRGGADNSYRSQWFAYGLNCLMREGPATVQILDSDGSSAPDSSGTNISIQANWVLIPSESCALPVRIQCSAVYTFFEEGDIKITFSSSLPKNIPPPPRFGIRFSIPEEFQNVQWLGEGPHETYDDRMSCAHTSLFSSQISELHTPYVFPQECGRRSNPRFI